MIREQYSEIPNLNLEVPSFVQPLGPEELNQEITFRTIKNVPSLRIDFPLPELKDYWKEKPSSFIGHNIGHEGVGSITSFLKQIGLATSLSAGGGSGANGFSFFRVDVGLTAEGLSAFIPSHFFLNQLRC
jgi:insulysin